jgi:hypothetical protein
MQRTSCPPRLLSVEKSFSIFEGRISLLLFYYFTEKRSFSYPRFTLEKVSDFLDMFLNSGPFDMDSKIVGSSSSFR